MELLGANTDLLASALRAHGLEVKVVSADRLTFSGVGVTGTWVNGTLTTTGKVDVDAVKREYSKLAILRTAKAQGWQVRFTPAGDIEATRRRFA